MSQASAEFIPTRIAILTVSSRRGEEDDTSGHWLREAAQEAGHQVVEKAIVKENRYAIRAQVSAWIASDNVQVVLITGGTGFTDGDQAPEALLPLFDLVSLGFLIGQGIGRWGNFVNQEAFGTNTTLPWGMYSEGTEAYLKSVQVTLPAGVTVDPAAPVHPTFLYESIWCLVGFAVLASLYKKRRFNGQIFLGYIIWYGLGRAWIEGLRTDSLLIGNTGLRASQLVAIGSVIVAAALMVIGLRNAKGKPLMVPLAVKDLKKQAEAGDRFTADSLPAGAPHAEFVKATDAMNARLDALDLSEVEIEEIETPKE